MSLNKCGNQYCRSNYYIKNNYLHLINKDGTGHKEVLIYEIIDDEIVFTKEFRELDFYFSSSMHQITTNYNGGHKTYLKLKDENCTYMIDVFKSILSDDGFLLKVPTKNFKHISELVTKKYKNNHRIIDKERQVALIIAKNLQSHSKTPYLTMNAQHNEVFLISKYQKGNVTLSSNKGNVYVPDFDDSILTGENDGEYFGLRPVDIENKDTNINLLSGNIIIFYKIQGLPQDNNVRLIIRLTEEPITKWDTKINIHEEKFVEDLIHTESGVLESSISFNVNFLDHTNKGDLYIYMIYQNKLTNEYVAAYDTQFYVNYKYSYFQ